MVCIYRVEREIGVNNKGRGVFTYCFQCEFYLERGSFIRDKGVTEALRNQPLGAPMCYAEKGKCQIKGRGGRKIRKGKGKIRRGR